jgi:Terminase large subunit, T4likevirus-type, N-terminal
VSLSSLSSGLEPNSAEALLQTLQAERNRRLTENRLHYYRPYSKQLEFHHAKARERLLMAGNQLGKTLAGGFEAAMHATGRYPDWWQGRRFDKPTVGWCCGVTGEVVRDTVQKVLVGRSGQIGSGAIPKDALGELVSGRHRGPARQHQGPAHLRGHLSDRPQVLHVGPREIPR